MFARTMMARWVKEIWKAFRSFVPGMGPFHVRTGKALALPAVQDVHYYPIRVAQGRIEIGVKKA